MTQKYLPLPTDILLVTQIIVKYCKLAFGAFINSDNCPTDIFVKIVRTI